MDEVSELGVAPENGRELAVWVAEHNNLARSQQLSIFCADVADPDLVRYLLLGHVTGLMERSQHADEVTPVLKSGMEVITQQVSSFFGIIQKIKGVEKLANRLYIGTGSGHGCN